MLLPKQRAVDHLYVGDIPIGGNLPHSSNGYHPLLRVPSEQTSAAYKTTLPQKGVGLMSEEDDPAVGQEQLGCAKCSEVQEHTVIDAGHSEERDGTLRVTECTVCGRRSLWVVRVSDTGDVETELVYPR